MKRLVATCLHNFPLSGWQKWVRLVSLTVATVGAVVLVLCRLCRMQDPLVYDEVYSWVTAQAKYPFATVFWDVLLEDVNLPLFNLLLRGWALWVPPTVPWMRLLSVLCSLGTLAVSWWMAPVSWTRLRRGVFCIFLASSFALTQYAGVLRTYSLSVLLITVCTLLALRLIEALQAHRVAPRWEWVTFWGTGLCCAYTHYFAACIFFSTTLFLFIIACRYKQARGIVLLGTFLVFGCWMLWVFHTLRFAINPQTDWWFHSDMFRSSWDIIERNLGDPWLSCFTVAFLIVGLLGLLLKPILPIAHKEALWLPIFQIGCLFVVLTGISVKHNLWFSRYFLISLPSLYLLLTGLLMQLTCRWAGWWVLLPVFVCGQYWQYSLLEIAQPDPSGLQRVFDQVSRLGYQRVLVLPERLTYPGPSLRWMLEYYMPPDRPLELIFLTPQNVERMKAPEYLPLVVPLGGFTFVMKASLRYPFHTNSQQRLIGQTSLLQDPVFRRAPQATVTQ